MPHSLLIRMRNVSDKYCRWIKTYVYYAITFFRKSWRLGHNVEKCGRARQATRQYNTAHAHCMMDDWRYRHMLRMRNIYAFKWQQWLRERTSILRLYVKCIASLVYFVVNLLHMYWYWVKFSEHNLKVSRRRTLVLFITNNVLGTSYNYIYAIFFSSATLQNLQRISALLSEVCKF
jgi:hypothetical protein